MWGENQQEYWTAQIKRNCEPEDISERVFTLKPWSLFYTSLALLNTSK